MIGVVKQYLNRRQCNCELVGAWSTMQNITAESPKNCERFMNENGLKYLIKCLKVEVITF
jgi:Zyg-11 family protein